MLRAEYRKEWMETYLRVLADPEKTGGYRERLLARHPRRQWLELSKEQEDGDCFYRYRVTGLKTLHHIFSALPIGKEQLKRLLLQILDTLEEGREYLLSDTDFVLSAQYLFVEPETLSLYFCYVPGYGIPLPKQLEELMEYFLNRVDYEDKEAVELLYDCYLLCIRRETGIRELRRRLEEEGAKAETAKQPEQAGQTERSEQDGRIAQAGQTEQRKNTRETAPNKEAEKTRRMSRTGRTGRSEKEDRSERPDREEWSGRARKAENAGEGKPAEESYGQWLWERFRSLFGGQEKKRQEKQGGRREKSIVRSEETAVRRERRVTGWEKDPGEWEKDPEGWEEGADGWEKECEQETRTTVLAVKQPSPEEWLVWEQTGESVPLTKFPFFVGSHPRYAHLCCDREGVSRLHFCIGKRNGQYFLNDLNSTNGTFVNQNEVPVGEDVRLCSGDVVRAGTERFVFSCPSEPEETKA